LSRKINEFFGRLAESSERSQEKDIRLGRAQKKKWASISASPCC